MNSFNQDCQDHSDNMFAYEQQVREKHQQEFDKWEEEQENSADTVETAKVFWFGFAVATVLSILGHTAC